MASAKRLLTCLHVAIGIQLALADQQCYYPDGSKAPEKPCSSAEGSACCPDKWECLDNGLCHYPANNLWGRYSCTDQSWKAEGCPSNLCTYGMTAYGGEAIAQCSSHSNQWCCNADATHVDCCKESPEPRPFFNLQDGKAYATIGGSSASSVPNLASITGSATSGSGAASATVAVSSDSPKSSGDGSSASDASSAGAKSASASATGVTTPVTSLQTQVSSGTAGVETRVVTSVIQPTATSASATTPGDDQKKSKLPVIVGCAVGIPLALALIGILIWLLHKRRTQNRSNQRPFSTTPDPYANGATTPEFAGGAKLHKKDSPNSLYKSESNVPELAGQSIGPGRPVSHINGRAELGTGAGFAAGAVPYAPGAVGIGGGNGTGPGYTPNSSWGTAPPGYSPGMNQQAWANTPAGMAEAPDTSVQHQARPIQGAEGLTGAGVAGQQHTEGGRYIPYRPPQGHDAHQMQHVPEMAELGAVRTPPEIPEGTAELSTVRTPPEENPGAAEMGILRPHPA